MTFPPTDRDKGWLARGAGLLGTFIQEKKSRERALETLNCLESWVARLLMQRPGSLYSWICHLQMAARLGTEGHQSTLTLLLCPHDAAVLTSHSAAPPVHFLQGGSQLYQTCPPSALSSDFLPVDYFLPSSLPTLFITLCTFITILPLQHHPPGPGWPYPLA